MLTVAAIGSTHQVGAKPEPAPAAIDFANCGDVIQSGGSDTSIVLLRGEGVTQPILPGTNVLSCSLGVEPTMSGGTLELVEWDPLALVPDPTRLALRARSFAVSSLVSSPVLVGWSPPLVARLANRLAESPRAEVALDYRNSPAGYTSSLRYQDAGPLSVPAASAYSNRTMPRVPLPGAHPVLNHVLCGGDSALQALSVVQSVVTPNYTIDTTYAELIQRFRVPARVRLRWIELAFAPTATRNPFVPGTVAILDAQGLDEPDVTPPPLVIGSLKSGQWWIPVWDTHFDFDQIVTLEPDHDYWLRVQTMHCYALYSRRKTGSEGADFSTSIGSFHTRSTPTGAWTEKGDQTLCFKLIGEPTGVVDVPRTAPARTGLRLHVNPNPMRGVATILWEGAVGPVRFEVIDARGRRVGAGSGAAAAAGGWTWSGAIARGGRLPASVYFVRASDGAGQAASERVVLVR